MVGSAVNRAFLPAKNLFEQVGDMMILTGKTIVSSIRPPYPYGGEFMSQFLFALRLCWFPLLISTVAFGFGAPGLQAANFLSLFGALDRLGGFFARPRPFLPGDFVTTEQGRANDVLHIRRAKRKLTEAEQQALHGELDRVLFAPCANLSRSAHHNIVDIAPVRLRVDRPRLDPREVE